MWEAKATDSDGSHESEDQLQRDRSQSEDDDGKPVQSTAAAGKSDRIAGESGGDSAKKHRYRADTVRGRSTTEECAGRSAAEPAEPRGQPAVAEGQPQSAERTLRKAVSRSGIHGQ